jgi:distribution and morphology protein 31
MDPGGDVSPGSSAKEYGHLGSTQNDILFRCIRNREQPAFARSVASFANVIDLWLTVIHPEYIARALSDYLTAETGAKIIFESAIVPKWKDSRISFKNVYVVRRPTVARDRPQSEIQATAIGYDISNHPLVHGDGEEEEEPHLPDLSEEDTNYTQFDLTIDSIDVTLSLWRWLDGKGLVGDAVIKGVRGILGELSLSTQGASTYL